uniref:Partial AB-hydrolase lipase domain-containing protein n=1 Tax=Leersia perrieri TaxID=77586 RepID=A0A0D9WSD6_9ORYZ
MPALSWRNQSSMYDVGDRCSPSPHPLGMCQERAAAFGYPCEEYKVTTQDGYILSLKRIPHGRSDSNNSTEGRPPAYWDWSFDELASYDLPAVLQFAYDYTGKKLHYIGHSLAVYWLGFHEFNPVGPVAHKVLSQICDDPEINCFDLFSAVAVIRHGGVRRFDYGNTKDNMRHYNQPFPPVYNLSSIPTHIPIFLTHGGEDFLGDVPDTRHLLRTLVRKHDSDNIEVLYVPDYAHADFVMAYNAPELIYRPMFEFFKRH